MRAGAHFTPELFQFLVELAAHNDKAWFAKNKERYRRAVQEPLLRFIADFAAPLAAISPHFVADPRPQGGSMFRIYRDVRFSRDKRPYKTHAAAQFRHRAGQDVHAPGFYLHLEPDNCFVGVGLWHPDGPALASIRRALADDPEEWRSATGNREFAARFSLGGETLSRPPRGFEADHPLIGDIKRKDFVAMAQVGEDEVLAAGFVDELAARYGAAVPFMRFLTVAVGQPFD